MQIPQLSAKLQKAIKTQIEALEDKTQDAEETALVAIEKINEKIAKGEQGLYDPLNQGDLFALTLGQMG